MVVGTGWYTQTLQEVGLNPHSWANMQKVQSYLVQACKPVPIPEPCRKQDWTLVPQQMSREFNPSWFGHISQLLLLQPEKAGLNPCVSPDMQFVEYWSGNVSPHHHQGSTSTGVIKARWTHPTTTTQRCNFQRTGDAVKCCWMATLKERHCGIMVREADQMYLWMSVAEKQQREWTVVPLSFLWASQRPVRETWCWTR